MTLVASAPIVLRLYEPIGLLFPEGAKWPSNAVDPPSCVLCQRRSPLPRAKTGWISAGREERLFLICSDCDWDRDGTELERLIIERVQLRNPLRCKYAPMTTMAARSLGRHRADGRREEVTRPAEEPAVSRGPVLS
jgi:hypothetical protein